MCNTSCYQKSALTACNTAAQTLTAAATALNLGSAAYRSGNAINFQGGSNVTVTRSGLYTLEYDVVLTGTAAGTESIAIAVNGTVLPCTLSQVTTAAATVYSLHGSTTIAINACNAVNPVITVVASGAAVTVNSVKTRILKEA